MSAAPAASTSASDRPDILGVGHASFTAINRAFYRSLVQAGYTVEMVIPKHLSSETREAEPQLPEDPPIHWTEVEGDNNRFWRFTELENILNARRPKIVYLENDPACLMAIQIGQWAGRNDASLVCYTNINDIPTVKSCLAHGQFKRAVRTLLYRRLAQQASPHLHSVFAISEGGAEAMEVLGLRGKIHIMPLGYDPALFYPNEVARTRVRAQLGLRHPVIAYFGRVLPIKGVHVLLDALEKLRDLEWHFLIDEFAGHSDSDYTKKIYDRIQQQAWLAERTVTFSASHTQMPDYMNACDIPVLPSVWKEQYGRVVPEAMACGKAVVVSDAGALPELAQGTGLVVPQNDPAALADALRRLHQNPQMRADLGKKAALRASRDLTIAAQLAVVGRSFEQILGRRVMPGNA